MPIFKKNPWDLVLWGIFRNMQDSDHLGEQQNTPQ